LDKGRVAKWLRQTDYRLAANDYQHHTALETDAKKETGSNRCKNNT
jgi:hypothetical protein